MPRTDSRVNKDAQTCTTNTKADAPPLRAVQHSAALDDAAHRATSMRELRQVPMYLHTSAEGEALVRKIRSAGEHHKSYARPEDCKAACPVNHITICAGSREEVERWPTARWGHATIHVAIGNWRVWGETGNVDAAEAALQSAYVHEAPRPPDMAVLQPNQLPPPTLDPMILGPELGRWAIDRAERSQAPVDYYVMTLLAVLSGAIGNTRAYVTAAGWSEQPILWVANVGRPSVNKSGPMKALSAVIARVETELMRGHAEAALAHEGKVLEADAVIAKWTADIQKAVEAGRPAPARPANAVPLPPLVPPRMRVTDSTPEALCALLGGTSRGLLVYADELAAWFASHARYNSNSRSFYLSAYDGGGHDIDRKGSGHMPVRYCTTSVVGGIQPDKVQSLVLAGDDDGMASRFLYAWPAPVPPRRVGGAPASDEVVYRALLRLRQLPRCIDDDGVPVTMQVPVEAEAEDHIFAWRSANYEAVNKATGLMAGSLGKRGGQMMRIATVLEFARWAAGPDGVPEPPTIAAAAIGDAIGLADTYITPMAARVFCDASAMPAYTDAAALAAAIIEQRPSRINLSEVGRTWRGFRGWDRDRMAAAADVLIGAGWLVYCGERKAGADGIARKGRRSSDYTVRPEVYELYDSTHLAKP